MQILNMDCRNSQWYAKICSLVLLFYILYIIVRTRDLVVDLVEDYDLEKGEVVYKTPAEGKHTRN